VLYSKPVFVNLLHNFDQVSKKKKEERSFKNQKKFQNQKESLVPELIFVSGEALSGEALVSSV
jgi:hypothetical protein